MVYSYKENIKIDKNRIFYFYNLHITIALFILIIFVLRVYTVFADVYVAKDDITKKEVVLMSSKDTTIICNSIMIPRNSVSDSYIVPSTARSINGTHKFKTPVEIEYERIKMIEEQKRIEEENERMRKEQERQAYLATCTNRNFSISTNIHTHSGLTADDIRNISGSYPVIYQLADVIAQMDEQENINALYIIGVLSLESDYGRSFNAINYNNMFGILDNDKPRYFTDKYSCVVEFTNIMNKYYVPYDRFTTDTIGSKYEPRNSEWDVIVTKIMNEFAEKYHNL